MGSIGAVGNCGFVFLVVASFAFGSSTLCLPRPSNRETGPTDLTHGQHFQAQRLTASCHHGGLRVLRCFADLRPLSLLIHTG